METIENKGSAHVSIIASLLGGTNAGIGKYQMQILFRLKLELKKRLNSAIIDKRHIKL